MWEFLRRVPHLFCASLFAICVAGTGAPPTTVNGTQGHSVSLHPSLRIGKGYDVMWIKTSHGTTIVKFSGEQIKYFGTEEYKRRITLHPGNFSLEIRDLRREDAGDYEVTVTPDSGVDTKARVRLEVYEPVSGTHITVQNITGNCNFTLICSVTSGDPTSFRWWRGGEALGDNSTHQFRNHGETVEVHHTAKEKDVVYRCEARNLLSVGTAQIQLGDVCKRTPSGHGASNHPGWIVAVVLVIIVPVVLIVVCWFKRSSACSAHVACGENSAGGNGPADPPHTTTIYAQLQSPRNRPAHRQPPEGNETVHEQKEMSELPQTVYDTIKPPATTANASPDTGSWSPGKLHPL